MLAEHLQQAAAETSTSDSSDRVVGVGAVPAGQEKVLQEVRRKAVRPSQGSVVSEWVWGRVGKGRTMCTESVKQRVLGYRGKPKTFLTPRASN